MPTVLREAGFEFVVYPNDHLPAHVHVFHGDDAAVIDVSGLGPELRAVFGMKKQEVRRALRIATDNLSALQNGWTQIHGSRLR
jgi:hypothetical protein